MTFDDAIQAQKLIEMHGYQGRITVPFFASERERDSNGRLTYQDYYLAVDLVHLPIVITNEMSLKAFMAVTRAVSSKE